MSDQFLEFTAKDLDRLIESRDDIEGWFAFKYDEYQEWVKDGDEWVKDPASERGYYIPEIEGWVNLEEEYGGEGLGDDYWVVVIVRPDDPELAAPRYFKKSGYYASFVGGELDGPVTEVRPREKMVTVYE